MRLITHLQNPELFDHPVQQFEVIETHISLVLLTGDYVYKIKKPVNFGFLDFSTLEKRKHYCNEEVRLNRRLAPQLYLEVVAIYGDDTNPNLRGQGDIIEYAVKMKQFPQSTQLDRVLERNQLTSQHIDKLAHTIADFHIALEPVPDSSPYGDVEHVSGPVLENFSQIRNAINAPEALGALETVEHWSRQQLDILSNALTQRKSQGFIRPCHGDMHLRNMALLTENQDEHVVIFDCIEFNSNFYLIDVMSEIAFLVMDLEDRGQYKYASRFLNLYLEITGDYSGLQVFNFYKVYRAMVRAKVDALRASQEDRNSEEYKKTFADFMQYLKLAKQYTAAKVPELFINYGLSGSGKSYFTRQFVEILPAIALRSDIERKRLFTHQTQQHSVSDIGQGIYSKEASDKTYQRLVELATIILDSGFNVIIDAANLKQHQRQQFIDLATRLGIAFRILHYHASPDTLRERVKHRLEREHDASDADLNVLEHQIVHADSLSDIELENTLEINTELAVDLEAIINSISHQ